jgi:hypothetical protein
VSDPKRAEFEGLVAAINAAADAGRWDTVDRLTDLALALSRTLLVEQGLTSAEHLAHNPLDMTRAEQRRAYGIARAKSKTPVAKAIVAKYGTLTRFARDARVTKTSLSNYLNDHRPCPERLYRRIKQEFPDVAWEPKRGTVP